LKVIYTPGARNSFNDQEADFKRRNIRDTHWDYTVLNELPGLTENILLHNMDSNPWYASQGWYWAFSFFLMSWLYRVLFILNSQKVTFDFAKIILK
jgi:TMEM151 family